MITQILDRLYVGDCENIEDNLKKFNINHVINVGGIDLKYLSSVFQYHLEDDGTNPDYSFSTILDDLSNSMNNNMRTLVCCRAGMSRSVFIVILWLEKMGMSRSEAYAFVKSKHPVAQVNLDLLRCM